MDTVAMDWVRITLTAAAGILVLKYLVGPGGLIKAGPLTTAVGSV